jgi:hypothetical protein
MSAYVTGELHLPVKQDPEKICWLSLNEDDFSRRKHDLCTQRGKGIELLVGELLEEEGGSEIFNAHLMRGAETHGFRQGEEAPQPLSVAGYL